jgi:hypothetical protein
MKAKHPMMLSSLAAAGLLLFCACGSDQVAMNPQALTPAQAKAVTGDVAVGHQLDADGTIAGPEKGNNFTAGQPVVVTILVGRAPVGTPVTIRWVAPDGQQLGTDQRSVAKGNEVLNFTAKDTSAWVKGDYSVDLSVGGQKVDTERFSVEGAEQAAASSSGQAVSAKAVSDVTVGHQLGAAGSIASGEQGKNFKPGQPVYVALATAGAVPGTTVEVDWYGPNDQKLGSDQKQIAAGDAQIHFAATQTASWSAGDYRADVLVNGEKVDSEHFSIVKTGAKADEGADAGSRGSR